jgi:hypothetical protein
LLRSAALSVAAAVSSSPRRYSTTLQGLGGTGLGGTGYTRARGVHGAVCTAQAVQDLDSRPVAAAAACVLPRRGRKAARFAGWATGAARRAHRAKVLTCLE